MTKEENDLVTRYLKIIELRVFYAIENYEISKSCTASLMLLFAAIDGMGKLYHPCENAGVTDRIKYFLNFVGDEYKSKSTCLCNLRNSLIHNALNYESFMSNDELTSLNHLSQVNGFLYINIHTMYNDIKNAYIKFKKLLDNNSKLKAQASTRLEEIEIGLQYPDGSGPTPPAIVFINTKRKTKKCIQCPIPELLSNLD